MEVKKISFGFTKTKKAEKPVVAERREFIECLEEKSIKVVGGEIVEEKAPLVIAMKPNTLVTAERLKQIAEEVEKGVEEVPAPGDIGAKDVSDIQPVENETLDQMAVRELLKGKQEMKVDGPALTVPVPSQPILDGQKESTLDDYDAVPVQEFGMAMLRGMGWTANKEQQLKHKQPELRPKGLGLGADKVIKENQKKNVSKDKKDEELSIVKNSFVKITTGKHSGYYGKVVSLDEDNGRVMVDITIKKETVSLSEFMMQAVSKSEYDKQSKVLNADSYEEYKKNETQKVSNRDSKIEDKRQREPSSSQKSTEHKSRKNDDQRSRRDKEDSNRRQERRHRSRSNSDPSRHRKKHKKRYSSNDSLSSSDSDRRTKKKEKKRYSSSDSDDNHRDRRKSSPSKKRDIDKKRKGKKKKRDRDRSPNYKKHRK